jgi:hypothetical protein
MWNIVISLLYQQYCREILSVARAERLSAGGLKAA